MQNIDVRFNATSNFGKVRADMAALTAQSEALNATFAKTAYATPPDIVDPTKWRNGTSAITAASRAYREAASSSGLLETQQIRSTSEADKYTRALQKQKLSIQDMVKHQGIMKEVYRDQLRQQRMTAQYWGTDTAGKHVTDISLPKNVPTELDTWRRKMGMFGNMAASAGTQVVNLGKNMQWSGRQLTVGFTYPMAMFAAGAGVMAYKVEDAFGKINKVYDYSAAALTDQNQLIKEQGQIRAQSMAMATEVAERYGLTVEKTLAVEQELAATGLRGNALMDTTSEVQRISALGDIDPEQTTKMVLSLQNAFKGEIGQDADKLTEALNYMNAASNATSLSLQDIAEATPRAATGLAQLGVSYKDMTALMVAMREAGVEAPEASNALKSATARILNDSILNSAAEQYKKNGANIDLVSIRDQAEGNFMKFLKLVSKAELANKNLTNQQKMQARASLFGTYQMNRLNAALVNVGDAQAGVSNQTSKAIELQSLSASELEHIAQVSEKAMTATPAAKFRKEWAKLQIELAEIGKPFLAAASEIMGVIGNILSKFNDLSDGKKNFLMLAAVAVGLAGPLIMLTGLAMNLFGQFVKGTGTIAKFIGISQLFTKEETAAALTADAVNQAMLKQQSTTSTLAAEINVLTAAYERASKAALQFLEVPGKGTTGAVSAPAAAPTVRGNTIATGYQMTPQEQGAFNTISPQDSTGKFTSKQLRLEQARNKLAYEYMAVNNLVARDATDLQKKTAATARLTGNMKENVSGTALAGGVAAASMAAMVLPLGEGASKAAEIGLAASMIVPAITMGTSAMSGFITRAKESVATQGAARRLAMQNSAETMKHAGRMNVLTAKTKAWGSALNAAMGPLGWASLALVGIGAGLIAINNHQKKVYQEQVDTQNALSNATENWATSAGKVVREFKKIQQVSTLPEAAGTPLEKRIESYESGDLKKTASAVGDLNGSDKDLFLMNQYIDLQNRAGMSARSAATEIKAMMIASGDSALEADEAAKHLLDTYGQFKKEQLTLVVDAQIDLLNDSNDKTLESSAKDLADTWSEAFANSTAPASAQALINKLQVIADKGMAKVMDTLSERGKQKFADLGIDSIDKYYQALQSGDLKLGMGDAKSGEYNDIIDAAVKAGQVETAIAGAVAEANRLGDGFVTIDDILNDVRISAKAMTFTEARAAARELLDSVAALRGDAMRGSKIPAIAALGDDMAEAGEETALTKMRQIALNQGIKQAGTLTKQWEYIMNGVKAEAEGAKGQVKEVKTAIASLQDKNISINIQAKQVGGILKAGMEGVKSDMIDDANYIFDTNQQAATDAFNDRLEAESRGLSDAHEAASRAMSERHEAATRALQERQEAQMRAFEDRWEKRKKGLEREYESRNNAIDRTIKKEQKADEIRQRLYENEKKRLQDLADTANTQIDFDIAINTGNLDEAAKIQNNEKAKSLSEQMDAEQKKQELATQTLIDRLEKKKERLDKMRDKALERLEKTEEKQRRHLERMQEAQSRAIQKNQEAQTRALAKQQEASARALEQRHKMEQRANERTMALAKKEHDQKLAMFKALPAASKKQLNEALSAAGLKLKDFGINTLDKRADVWGTYFQKHLVQHMRVAGAEIANDNFWSNVTKQIADQMLKGFGFASRGAFEKFVKTGKLPAKPKAEGRHEGGVVGSGPGSLGSLAHRGPTLTASERMIRAQNGEFVVNAKQTAKYREVLESINSGRAARGRGEGLGGVDTNTRTPHNHQDTFAPLGAPMAAGYQMMKSGIRETIKDNVIAARRREQLRRQRAKARRDAAASAAGTGPGPLNSGPMGPVTPLGESAINWAASRIGDSGWYRMCLSFVRQAFGAAGGVKDAKTSWAQTRNKFSASNPSKIPAGVPVFWNGGSNGHVVLSTGGGRAISTDYPTSNIVGGGTISGISSWLGQQPSGWAADINGKSVYPLRRGGTIMSDNTLVSAHKGETILPARLTEKFKQNVSNYGGETVHVTVDLRGAMVREDVDIKKAVNEALKAKDDRIGRKRVVK
jgi:hypothetical protein